MSSAKNVLKALYDARSLSDMDKYGKHFPEKVGKKRLIGSWGGIALYNDNDPGPANTEGVEVYYHKPTPANMIAIGSVHPGGKVRIIFKGSSGSVLEGNLKDLDKLISKIGKEYRKLRNKGGELRRTGYPQMK